MKSFKYIDKRNNVKYRNYKSEFHREDGPAVIMRDGTEYWYLNDRQLNKQEIEQQKQKSALKKKLQDLI